MKRHDVVGAPVGFRVVLNREPVPDQKLGVTPGAVRDSHRIPGVEIFQRTDDDGPLSDVHPAILPVVNRVHLPLALARLPVVVRAVQHGDQHRALALLRRVARLLAGHRGVEGSAVDRRDRPAKDLAEEVHRYARKEPFIDGDLGEFVLYHVPIVFKVLLRFARHLEDVRPSQQLHPRRVVPPRRGFVKVLAVQEPVIRRPRGVLDGGSHVQRVDGHLHGERDVPSGHAQVFSCLTLYLTFLLIARFFIARGSRRGVLVDEGAEALILERGGGGDARALGDAEDDVPVLDGSRRAQTAGVLLVQAEVVVDVTEVLDDLARARLERGELLVIVRRFGPSHGSRVRGLVFGVGGGREQHGGVGVGLGFLVRIDLLHVTGLEHEHGAVSVDAAPQAVTADG